MFGKDEAQFNSICILVNQMVLVCFRLFEISKNLLWLICIFTGKLFNLEHLYKSADALSKD